MKRGWFGGAAVFLGAAVTILYFFREKPTFGEKQAAAVAVRATSATDEKAALQSEIAALRREVRGIERAVAMIPPPSGSSARADTPTDEPRARDPLAIEAKQKEMAAQIQHRMDTLLRGQAPDRGARIEVERQLGDLYRSPEFVGTSLDSVECGAAFCRVSSRHESRETRSTFARAASKHAPFDTEIFYTYGDGDPPTSTLYVARAGHRLPR